MPYQKWGKAMDSLSSVIQKLEPLGVYNLKPGSNIYWELYAYCKELDRLNTELDEMVKEAFIPTAETYGLTQKEKLYDQGSEGISTALRRSMLIKRFSARDDTFTLKDITVFISGLGIEFQLTESPKENTVIAEVSKSVYTQEKESFIKEQIQGVMPAHLNVEVYFGGKSWNVLDGQNDTFSRMDALNYTWEQFDNLKE